MNEISMQKIQEITPFWVFYEKENGRRGNIQFSACANNFAVHRGGGSADGLQAVGLRYEKDGFGCYELFNVGHTLIKFPLTPNFVQKLLGGKNAADKLRQQYGEFEQQLNGYGWKTVAE